MRRVVKSVVILVVSLYLLLCVIVYLHQSKFIFIPQREVEFTPRDYGCSFEDVHFDSGGKRVAGWWLAADPGAAQQVGGRKLIYYHGNGGSIGANAAHACRLSRIGFGVLIFDYRGYGKSEGGPPTEKVVYEDADAAWQFLLHRGLNAGETNADDAELENLQLRSIKTGRGEAGSDKT